MTQAEQIDEAHAAFERRKALLHSLTFETYQAYVREDPRSMMQGYLPERLRSAHGDVKRPPTAA